MIRKDFVILRRKGREGRVVPRARGAWDGDISSYCCWHSFGKTLCMCVVCALTFSLLVVVILPATSFIMQDTAGLSGMLLRCWGGLSIRCSFSHLTDLKLPQSPFDMLEYHPCHHCRSRLHVVVRPRRCRVVLLSGHQGQLRPGHNHIIREYLLRQSPRGDYTNTQDVGRKCETGQ